MQTLAEIGPIHLIIFVWFLKSLMNPTLLSRHNDATQYLNIKAKTFSPLMVSFLDSMKSTYLQEMNKVGL